MAGRPGGSLRCATSRWTTRSRCGVCPPDRLVHDGADGDRSGVEVEVETGEGPDGTFRRTCLAVAAGRARPRIDRPRSTGRTGRALPNCARR